MTIPKWLNLDKGSLARLHAWLVWRKKNAPDLTPADLERDGGWDLYRHVTTVPEKQRKLFKKDMALLREVSDA